MFFHRVRWFQLNQLVLIFTGYALVLFFLGGCAENKNPQEIALQREVFVSDTSKPPSELLVQEYRLAPGDEMNVLFQFSTWQQKDNFTLAIDHKISVKFVQLPELNETQRIQPNGNISLPYIGEIYVVGKTISELTQELRKAYSKELVNPELYVTVDDFQAGMQELKKDLYTPAGGLSRLVTVRPDGICTFPLLGDVSVVQKTLSELNEILNQAYNEKYAGISVLLFLEKQTDTVVYVAGEVKIPGRYTITRPTTAMEVIALAEGARQSADLENALVVRKINGAVVGKRINIMNNFSATAGDVKVFYLKPNDFLYLPQRRLFEIASVVKELQDVILFRGWAASINVPILDMILNTSD